MFYAGLHVYALATVSRFPPVRVQGRGCAPAGRYNAPMRILSLVCLVGLPLSAQSAQGLPNSKEPAGKEKSQVSANQKEAQTLPKGTVSPNPQFNSADHDTTTKKEDKTGNSNFGPDRWTIILTAGLVVVGAGQVWVLLRQANLTKEGLAETRAATHLTRESLILAHRPKLIVRNVAMDREEAIFKWQTVPAGTKPVPLPVQLTGTLRVVNVGNSVAHVTAWQCQVLIAAQLPTRSPLPVLTSSLPTPVTLASGVYGTMTFPTSPQPDITDEQLIGLYAQKLNLYVLGQIVYEDGLHNIRTTWFCRKGVYDSTRLTPEKDSDYESAD